MTDRIWKGINDKAALLTYLDKTKLVTGANGADLIFIGGVSAGWCVKNFADQYLPNFSASDPLTVALDDRSLVLGDAEYIDTLQDDVASSTHYVLARFGAQESSFRSSYFGADAVSSPYGVDLFMDGTTLKLWVGTWDEVSTGTRVEQAIGGYSDTGVDAPWRLIRCDVDAVAKTMQLHDLTAGASSTVGSFGSNVRETRNTNTVRIGSNYSNYYGERDIAAVLRFPSVLSADSRTTVESALRNLALNELGVTV
jgi:hypothetical protein